MIKAAIIGGAGYTGGELFRLLLRHPKTDIVAVHSRSNSGKKISTVHQDLVGETEMEFSDALPSNADILFLCTGHGEAVKFLGQNNIPDTVRIIDLSQDFRLADSSTHGKRKFIYGLPELNRNGIIGADSIANPGCFATAIQLALLPLAANKLLQRVNITGITGSTGAGQSLSPTSHFSWRAGNIQAYKTLTHQHLAETRENLGNLQGNKAEIFFVPWRGDFTRGIFVSSQLECSLNKKEIEKAYRDFYETHPFTHISEEAISLKQVVNTNKCLIQPEFVDGMLVVHSAIDNLLKGASGQAVQNMNLMFGLDECMGLQLKASAF